jgi:ABC-type antimicrobial peptide transport system permease subunit
VVLLLAVVFWSYAADYQAVLGFVVCAGAVRVAFLAAAVRRYDWASLFIGMALLYNPAFPLFALTGRVAFFLVIASITAFAASLFLLKPRLTPSVAGY